MRNAYDAILKFAAHDPLLAFGLACLALLIVPLGMMHLVKIFVGFFLVLVQEFKDQAAALGKVLGRVKQELSTWKVDE
jgi:hypothetical protein